MAAELIVLAPGPMTTVQDAGRPDYQARGVPVSGALDGTSLALANALVGNPPTAAGLECLRGGIRFRIEGAGCRVAVAGPGASLILHDGAGEPVALPGLTGVWCAPGAVLTVRTAERFAAAYLAIGGGVAVPEVLGSRATAVISGFGGHAGRPLRAGDRLPIGPDAGPSDPDQATLFSDAPRADALLDAGSVLRVVWGPQAERFSPATRSVFQSAPFATTTEADRMGLRLAGPKLFASGHPRGHEISPEGIAAGSIQVPASGQAIVLWAERQTTGSYAKIATIIGPDLMALARLPIGAAVRFRVVDWADAEAAHRAHYAALAAITANIIRVPRSAVLGAANTDADQPAVASADLLAENLIGGVVDGLADALGDSG